MEDLRKKINMNFWVDEFSVWNANPPCLGSHERGHGNLSVPDNYVLDVLPYVTLLTIQIFKINPCIVEAEKYESCMLLNNHSQEA